MARRRFTWSWPGAVVLILAICLGGGWATAIVLSASPRTPPITDTTKDLLNSIGGVLAGGIAAFLGASLSRKRRPDDDDDDDVQDEIP